MIPRNFTNKSKNSMENDIKNLKEKVLKLEKRVENLELKEKKRKIDNEINAMILLAHTWL